MKGFTAMTTRKVKRVTTWRAGRAVVQNHRGYEGRVRLNGERDVFKCGHWHQKRSAAQECAERTGKRLVAAKPTTMEEE